MSATPAEPRSPLSRAGVRWPYLLVPFIPIGIGLELAGASAALIFAAAALGIVPTAALMGRATVELAARAGPGIGSLLNATFGNAPELIIAFFALNAGLHEVVKASLVGSILGNLLLVMGASALAGGFGRPNQRFDATAAGVQALTLLLAVVALIMPAVLVLVGGDGLPLPSEQAVNFPGDVESLSVGVAIVLLIGYAGALVFSLRTHRDLFNPVYGEDDHLGTPWSVRRSVAMLAVAGAVAAVMSEILVESLTEASDSIGLSRFFLGIIVVAAISNAAEHWVAVSFARRDKLDIALNISITSSTQIALFVAPVLMLRVAVRRAVPDGARLQRPRDRRAAARGADRQPHHPAGRVLVVRGRPAARRLPRDGADLRVRLELVGIRVGLELLLVVAEVVLLGVGDLGRPGLKALEQLVAVVLVDRQVVGHEHPFRVAVVTREQLGLDGRGVVDHEHDLGLRIEVRPGAVEELVDVEAAGGWHPATP